MTMRVLNVSKAYETDGSPMTAVIVMVSTFDELSLLDLKDPHPRIALLARKDECKHGAKMVFSLENRLRFDILELSDHFIKA